MINSLSAKTAQGVRDVGLDISTLLLRDVPPQSGFDYDDEIARILGSTVADPLARMQFEYRATASPRLFSADAHEAAARRLSSPDFFPDHVGSTKWTLAFLTPGNSDAASANAGWLDLPAGAPAMFGAIHGSWGV